MKQDSQWIIDGRKASRRDLMEAMALARQHRAKIAAADREARARDAAARAVGASLRRSDKSISCRPRFVKARLDGSHQLNRFEKRFGLAMLKRAVDSGSGTSSFHFKLTARGLGAPRKAGGRLYRRGEAVGVINYILRHCAREDDDQGIESNISFDPDRLATVFAALEELEIAAGRDNANVYMSLIISLPAELTSPERKALLGDICAFLAEHGLSYVGIQHKPDRDGDQRNFHAHVLFSWRPMEMTPDGCAFAAGTMGSLNTPTFVTEFRAHAAKAMNAAMETAGHKRRFTAERTRSGPGSSVADKHGAGRKHRDRRAERIALAEREKALFQDRRSALSAAIDAVQNWVQKVVPDRQVIVTALRARQARIMNEAARREITAALEMSAVVHPNVVHTSAVSHEKLTEANAGSPASTSLATSPLPSSVPAADAIIPPEPKETDHANRPVYASALGDVRRHFAAREPDHRGINGGEQTGPLSGVQRLSACGLASGLAGPQMLLHGLAPDNLGEAVGPIVGSGDGLRRSRAGDHEIEGRSVATPVSKVSPEPGDDPKKMAAEKLASLPEKTRTTRTVDALRQIVRTRAEPVELEITEPHANHVQHANSSEVPPGDYVEEPRRYPASAQPSAAPEKSRIRPSASDHIAEAKQRAAGPGTKTPHCRADQNMPRRHRKLSEAERNGLIARLERRPLPLREVEVREGGRERTIYELVPDKALPDDAELIAQAVEQQRDALFQELFRRRFEQLLEAVRAVSMAAPIASAADRRAMVNPTSDPGLAAALTAAEGSPSFDAAMITVTAPPLEEEHGLIEQQLARNQRGGRH